MEMKKVIFLPILALAVASCSDDKGPWGIEQVNPQQPAFDHSMLVVTPTQTAVDLKTWNDENQAIPVAEVAINGALAEGYHLEFTMEMSPDADFTRVAEIPTTFAGQATAENRAETSVAALSILVAPDDWQAAYSSTISKGPKAKTVNIRFAPYAVNGKERVRLGEPTYFVGVSTVTVTPIPSDFVIEDAYYLLGSINGWNVATAVKFEHSDADVYDDPVFTLFCDVNGADGWWWKVIPASTYATGDWVSAANGSFGVAENGSGELEGMLVGRTATDDCGAGCLKVSGRMKMTLNMEELTYKFESALEYLYTPGDANGWNQLSSQALGTNDYANYYGFARLSPGGFKFSTQTNWDGTNYGAGAAAGELSADGGAGNLSVETAGLYWCHVDIPKLTYKADPVTTIGAIGDFNGWASSVALTPDADKLVWEGTVDFGDGKGGFKLRCNDDWVISLGGDPNSLSWDNAPNIDAPGAGKYTVTLFLDAVPYVVEFAAQ